MDQILSSTYAPEELAESIQEREYPEDDDQVSLSEEAIEGIQADVSAVERVLVFIIPVLVSILGVGVWILVGRALRPVQSIAGQVSEITASTLDERVPVPDSKDEIADLANLMNAMLDRIEEGTTLQRRFVADASHELRSPLSTIKVAAEIAQVSPDSSEAPTSRWRSRNGGESYGGAAFRPAGARENGRAAFVRSDAAM